MFERVPIVPLDFDQRSVAVEVLADAFRDYPVMRWVLGDVPDYESGLARLVGLFVANRAWRGEPMFALEQQGRAVGVVTMTLPASPEAPLGLAALREETWAELGAEARARYDAFAAASAFTARSDPHHHINMLGVRREQQGAGHARTLLEVAHIFADADPDSCGVSLSTELARNLSLYEYFGYRVASHARVSEVLETWTLFRPRGTAQGRRNGPPHAG
jgi:GNAT superfamily N-acetyltransferase